MANITEFKRLVLDFNTTCNRLKKAEEYWDKCTDAEYEKSINLYHSILEKSSCLKNRLEVMLGRPLTDSEAINGYKI